MSVTGKTKKPSLWDYVEVCSDFRVLVMIMQWPSCKQASLWPIASLAINPHDHAALLA